MRAVGFAEYAGPARIELLELPDPMPDIGQVRVRVLAATINPADVQFCRGDHRRFVEAAQPPFCGGLEFVGDIDVVGPDVSLDRGARVAGTAHFIPSGRGAHAEYVVVDANWVAAVPAECSAVEAATVPMNGLTARVVVDALPAAIGGPVVVTGAAGAVGGYVTELAAVRGHEVVAVSAPEDEGALRAMGAVDFVPRGTDVVARLLEKYRGGVPALVDAAMLESSVIPAVADNGSFLALRPGHVPASTRGIEPRLVSFRRYQARSDVLEGLLRATHLGELTTRVAHVLQPEDAGAGFAIVDRPGTRGRVVLDWH